MKMIRFQYKGSTRVALELEGDDRMINCMYCLQASKDGDAAVGHRSFKVPDMRDIQEVEDPQSVMEGDPDFLAAVQEELRLAGPDATSQSGRIVREGGKRGTDSTNQAGRLRR